MSDTVARNERQYDVRYISCKSCQHPIYDDSKSFTGAVFQVNLKIYSHFSWIFAKCRELQLPLSRKGIFKNDQKQ